MTTATTTAQWVTAADGDQLRHRATLDGDTWRATCGATFTTEDTRPIIPRRCIACLDQLDVLQTISETDPFPCCRQSSQHDAQPDGSR